jgi:hypothetical protein
MLRSLRDRRPFRDTARSIGGGAIGFLPFVLLAGLMASRLEGPETTTEVILRSLTMPAFRPSAPPLFESLLYEFRFLVFNFAGPQILLVGFGLFSLRGRPLFAPLFAIFVIGLVLPFFFSHLGDRYIFLLPTIVAGALLAGIGGARFLERRPARGIALGLVLAASLLPPAAYLVSARTSVMRKIGLFDGVGSRQERTFLWPGKAGTGDVETLTRVIFDALPNEGTLYASWGEGPALLYLQRTEERKPDLQITIRHREFVPEEIRDRARSGRVFVTKFPWIPGRPFPKLALRPILPDLVWEADQP